MKRCKRAHLSMGDLKAVMDRLINQTSLEAKHRDHRLSGNNKDFRECHIHPDWLLVYRIEGNVITFTRTGSHAELFGM